MFSVDRQLAFSVHYSKKQDNDLDFHMDGAEVTFNICLKNTMADGLNRLAFGRINGEKDVIKNDHIEVDNEENSAVMFLGQHFHAIKNNRKLKKKDGERINLVIRLLSTEFRRSPIQTYYQKCLAK